MGVFVNRGVDHPHCGACPDGRVVYGVATDCYASLITGWGM